MSSLILEGTQGYKEGLEGLIALIMMRRCLGKRMCLIEGCMGLKDLILVLKLPQ